MRGMRVMELILIFSKYISRVSPNLQSLHSVVANRGDELHPFRATIRFRGNKGLVTFSRRLNL